MPLCVARLSDDPVTCSSYRSCAITSNYWGGRTRTYNFPGNSRMFCQLNYTPNFSFTPHHTPPQTKKAPPASRKAPCTSDPAPCYSGRPTPARQSPRPQLLLRPRLLFARFDTASRSSIIATLPPSACPVKLWLTPPLAPPLGHALTSPASPSRSPPPRTSTFPTNKTPTEPMSQNTPRSPKRFLGE
jgi:hypothetical protein